MKHFVPKPAMCLMIAAIAGMYGGCADSQQVTVLPTVGPIKSVATAPLRAMGNLIVCTAVEVPPISSDTLFYPHSGYMIYDSHGARVNYVRNHLGAWDETPYTVSLPAGRYLISAQSEFGGDVKAPVIIVRARTTVVDLRKATHYSISTWTGD